MESNEVTGHAPQLSQILRDIINDEARLNGVSEESFTVKKSRWNAFIDFQCEIEYPRLQRQDGSIIYRKHNWCWHPILPQHLQAYAVYLQYRDFAPSSMIMYINDAANKILQIPRALKYNNPGNGTAEWGCALKKAYSVAKSFPKELKKAQPLQLKQIQSVTNPIYRWWLCLFSQLGVRHKSMLAIRGNGIHKSGDGQRWLVQISDLKSYEEGHSGLMPISCNCMGNGDSSICLIHGFKGFIPKFPMSAQLLEKVFKDCRLKSYCARRNMAVSLRLLIEQSFQKDGTANGQFALVPGELGARVNYLLGKAFSLLKNFGFNYIKKSNGNRTRAI